MREKIKSVDAILLDEHNANEGTVRGQELLEQSLADVGAGRSILVDKHGRVIAGNKTFTAWTQLSDDIEIVKTDGSTLVIVQRDDLDLDDPHGLARKLAYYDNRVAELDIAWNAEQIFYDLQEGMDLTAMFAMDELDSLLADVRSPDFEPVDFEMQSKIDRSTNDSASTPLTVCCPECGHEFTP